MIATVAGALGDYFAVTARDAEPPRLLLTVTFTGFDGQLHSPRYWPPPEFESVPISAPLDDTYAFSVADELVLVASTRSRLPSYSARVIETVSAVVPPPPPASGGLTWSETVFVTPPAVAEIDENCPSPLVFDFVVTVNVALVAPAGTVTLGGTVAQVVLLLDSVTGTPLADAGADSVTVPVEGSPPVTGFGLKESDASVSGGSS